MTGPTVVASMPLEAAVHAIVACDLSAAILLEHGSDADAILEADHYTEAALAMRAAAVAALLTERD